MDIKFNKGAETELQFPLKKVPSNTGSSKIVSPRVGNNYGIACPINKNNIETMFWEVMETRTLVSNGEFPYELMEKYYPENWGTFEHVMPGPLSLEKLTINRPDALANVVHMDSPIDLGLAMMTWALSNGAIPRNRHTGHVDFLNAIPDMISILGNNVKAALDKAFDIKYYYGVARPEELYAELSGCVNPEKMTEYPEGCPAHPSYPAGHGAAAGACAYTILNHYFLSPEQEKVIKDAAYHWAMYRTLAGVHYAIDNIAGLVVGGIIETNFYNNQYISSVIG